MVNSNVLDAPGTMKVKVVDCKGQSEGKTCYDLCFNKRHVVVRIDNESGEGKIVGEKDSHIFADYDQESGDIIVSFVCVKMFH